MTTRTTKALTTYAALLRGVNVAGKHCLPMKELAEMFLGCGCVDVRTFIQSGNVVFRATPAVGSRIKTEIPAKINSRFGFDTPLILRTAAELRHSLENNPFTGNEACVHLMFLADFPEPAAVSALKPDESTSDRFMVRDREIYLLLPNGMARTKLNNSFFDRRLRTVSTVRNWRTVGSLVELANQP